MLSEIRTLAGPACPAPFNLAAYVLAAGAATPEKIALQILTPAGDELWSYARLTAAVLGVAAGLAGLGLAPGSRVLLRLGNDVTFPLAFLGAVAAGYLPAVCPAALSLPEVTRLMATLDPALVIAAPGLSLPQECVVPVLSAQDLHRLSRGAPGTYQMGDPGRAAYLVYTSGTSGQPRAVVHAHRAIWARRMMHQGWYGLTREDRLLHAGAFNWTFTLGTGLLDPWTVGATALVAGSVVAPDDLTGILHRANATLFAAVPAVYRKMLKSGATLTLPHLRHGLAAGEKLAPQVRDAWTGATARPLYEAYGMSECSTFISSSPTRAAPDGATGYAQPGRHIAVLDAEGAPVARGQPGVLAVHRTDPGLFLGYFNAPQETEAKFQGDWFVTGDLARMDEDGAIHIVGRADDMMNAGGFRVSPDEVETALMRHPGAGEVAVVELTLSPGTTIIAAYYTGSASEQAMAAHASTELARYKQPRMFRQIPSLPHTANGKVNRRKLREDDKAI